MVTAKAKKAQTEREKRSFLLKNFFALAVKNL
jgi:hypothetical protein